MRRVCERLHLSGTIRIHIRVVDYVSMYCMYYVLCLLILYVRKTSNKNQMQ